jgi:hypothetical protein
MRRWLGILIGCVLMAPSIWAAELAGVEMVDEITVGDATLELNGMGVRKKLWVKVYVAGLYLESAVDDAEAVVNQPGTKRVVMRFLTNKATEKKMDAAWYEGFEANSPTDYARLQGRVEQFAGFFGDMKVGDLVELTLVPGAGTTVTLNGRELGVIEGDDFATALLRVWLGDSPPTEELKTGLLGG